MKVEQAVIFCGGRGSRLKPYTDKLPKPMIKCNGKPFLFYLLEKISSEGIRKFVLLTGYKEEIIREFFQDGSLWGWDIQYSHGPENWKTAKRLLMAENLLEEYFFLLYADNFIEFNLDLLIRSYLQNLKPVLITVVEKTPGNISVDENNIVTKYDNSRNMSGLSLVEIGFMITRKDIVINEINSISGNHSFSSVIKSLATNNMVSSFFEERSYYSISDPVRWKLTEKFLSNKKILFIDRDGVINVKAPRGEYITEPNNFIMIPDTIKALLELTKRGFSFIIITNQAGIARRHLTIDQLTKIHLKMNEELLKHGIGILDIYFCPHGWNDNCHCRKPKPGMLFQASKDYDVRLNRSIFVGDDPRDCETAYNAGAKSILLDNSNLSDKKIKEVTIAEGKSFLSFVDLIDDFYMLNFFK